MNRQDRIPDFEAATGTCTTAGQEASGRLARLARTMLGGTELPANWKKRERKAGITILQISDE